MKFTGHAPPHMEMGGIGREDYDLKKKKTWFFQIISFRKVALVFNHDNLWI